MLQMVGVTTTGRRPTPAVLVGWSLRSKMTGVLDHLRGWEPLGARDAAQTSLYRSLALLRDSGALTPPKMVATACYGS